MNVTDIQFIDDVNFDDSREAVLFYAQIGKKKIKCGLGQIAVNDHYQTTDTKENAIENYRKNKIYFQDIAKNLIKNDRFNENGEIFISSRDIR
ncbi:MAG: DUF1488 family protein [Thermodesulfovibrionales bacterium]|nr:DUF1488 family protein [Thermodesulfovibrionales bacterium]